MDWDTSGSDLESSVEIDLTRLSRGLALRVEPSLSSSSVDRDLTRLARGRWLGEDGPGERKLGPMLEQLPREPGDEGERGTWGVWDCKPLSSSTESCLSLEREMEG